MSYGATKLLMFCQATLCDCWHIGRAAAVQPPTSPVDQAVATNAEQAAPPAVHKALTPDSAGDARCPPASEPAAEPAEQQPTAHASLHTPSTALTTDPTTVPHIDQTTASTAAAAAASPAAYTVAEPVCPACLGVLQTPAGGLQAVPAAMLAGLPEAEGNAGSWQTCTSGSCDALAQCVRLDCISSSHCLACGCCSLSSTKEPMLRPTRDGLLPMSAP